MPGTDAGRSKDHRPVTITFTKWVITVVPADPVNGFTKRFLMEGGTEGDIVGEFVGEVSIDK
jgi:hypothetical protein